MEGLNLGSRSPMRGAARWWALAFGVVVACARGGSPEEGGVLSVELPEQANKPSLYVSERGFGVIAAYDDIRTISDMLRVYNSRLGLIRIVRRGDDLVALPTADFWSEQRAKGLPECAATGKGELVRVAFQELRHSGIQVLVGALRPDRKAEPAVQDKTLAVSSSDLSGPCSLSFVQSSAERLGIVGIDAYGRVWVSLKGHSGRKPDKKWDVWSRIVEGFAPEAALVGDGTLLIFYIERKQGGPINILRCERKDDRWERRERHSVFSDCAKRIALGAKVGQLSLLIAETRQGRHQLRLLVSKDEGRSWKTAGRAELALPGTMTDLALAKDWSSAGGILENAEGKSKVFVLSLRKASPE